MVRCKMQNHLICKWNLVFGCSLLWYIVPEIQVTLSKQSMCFFSEANLSFSAKWIPLAQRNDSRICEILHLRLKWLTIVSKFLKPNRDFFSWCYRHFDTFDSTVALFTFVLTITCVQGQIQAERWVLRDLPSNL